MFTSIYEQLRQTWNDVQTIGIDHPWFDSCLPNTHRAYTEKCIAYHLGKLERDFASGDLDQAMVENMDETHFLINQDNHRTLGYVGDPNVNYADVSSGGEGMTMVLRISGGVNSKVEAPL